MAISQSQGKIAYLVSHFDATHHELMLHDGKSERILRQWTSSFYPASYPDKSGLDGHAGGAIALSNSGNQIAITCTPKGTLQDPTHCELAVQDLASGQFRVVTKGVCDSRIRLQCFMSKTPACFPGTSDDSCNMAQETCKILLGCGESLACDPSPLPNAVKLYCEVIGAKCSELRFLVPSHA